VRNNHEAHRFQEQKLSTIEDLDADTIGLASNIVAAYVSHNTMVAVDVPKFIEAVHAALSNATTRIIVEPKKELIPVVPIKKSVTPDCIICLEDGKKFKSLKRHLRTRYDMSPEEYRERWGLPHDYPMVAPLYAESRSRLAKEMGLGQRRKPEEPAPVKKSRKA
jgi:predicted transcriptional regulator